MSSQQDLPAGADGPGSSPAAAGGTESLPPPAAMPGPVPADVQPVARPPAGNGPDRRAVPGRPGGVPGAPGLTRKRAAWTTRPDGTTVFRLIPPLVLWWAWIAFAVFNAVDLVVQSPDWFSLKVGIAILTVTGIMYACAFRPKVVSDDGGLTIRNPFRDYRVPWGGVAGVYLGDSVEIQCGRPDRDQDKTIYSWALYSPRRKRAKAELRQGFGSRRGRDRHDQRARRRYEVPDPTAFGRMPAKAKELASQHPSHVMAGELARRLEAARKKGTPDGVVTGWWAWQPIMAVLIPAIALAVVIAAT